jgi:hypothetical protein
MTGRDDGRIWVRFGAVADAEPGEALLIEGQTPAEAAAIARFTVPARIAAHPMGCACCAPRGPVSAALGGLFLARARGELKWFRSVLAVTQTAAGAAAVRAALTQDVITAARFRLEA